MWGLKILKGPGAGQTLEMKNGQMKLGRGETCALRIASPNISKEHALLVVSENDVFVQDLNSRNGTFVNGIKVKSRALKRGDRLSFHDVIVELVDNRHTQLGAQLPVVMTSSQLPSFDGNAALQAQYNSNEAMAAQGAQMSAAQPAPNNIVDAAKSYFENVVMPAVYQLAQNMELKWVLGIFVVAYVALVTVLSVVPMVQISKASIEKESQRRALTIAQGLADRYQVSMVNGTTGSFDIRFAEKEDGVRAAFILAVDGSIMAPVSKSGAYAKEEFVHSARKSDDTVVTQIDSSTIGASVPIRMYNPETGDQSVRAYGMVLYNMGSLAIDDGRIISLFSQVLGIALLLGFILFLILYKLVEFPVMQLNSQLDVTLRNNGDKVTTDFIFPPLQSLTLSISSLLGRIASLPTQGEMANKDIYQEAMQLVRIIGTPAMSFDMNGSIIAMNEALAQELNVSLTQYDNSSVRNIPDDAIATILPELVDRAMNGQIDFISSPVFFKNQDGEMNLQPIRGPKGIDYFILTLKLPEKGEM